jgi:hypothetical protein
MLLSELQVLGPYQQMGVSLTYFDYGKDKGYVYEPTGIVVGGATATITSVSMAVSRLNLLQTLSANS